MEEKKLDVAIDLRDHADQPEISWRTARRSLTIAPPPASYPVVLILAAKFREF
jgi:hypothetical protein